MTKRLWFSKHLLLLLLMMMMMMMMMMMCWLYLKQTNQGGCRFNSYRLSGAALFWLRVLVWGLSTEQEDKQPDRHTDRVGVGTGPRGQDGIDIHSGKEGLGEEVADRPDVYRGGGGGEEGCTRPADRCEVTDAVHHPRALPHPAVLHHRQHAVVPGNRGPEKVLLFLKSSLSLSLTYSTPPSASLWVTRSSPSSPWPLWPWPDSCTCWAQTGRQTHTC